MSMRWRTRQISSRTRASASTVLAVLVVLLMSSGQIGASPARAGTSPLFLISPTSFDFGTQPIHSPSPEQAVTVTNISGSSILMEGTGGGAGIFGGVQNCQGETLASGASCQMFYQFTPTHLGAVTGKTGGTWNGQAYSLSFKGTGVPQFRITPTSLDFGSVQLGSTSAPQQLTVTNVGSESVTMTGTGGGAGVFGGVQDCQGVTVPPAGSCHMIYQFTPAADGPATGRTTGSWNGQHYSLRFKGVGLPTAAGAAEFVALPAARLLHTTAPKRGYAGPKPAAGSTVHLQVAGVGPADVPTDAHAVLLDVTASNATHNGSVWVYACGTTRPKNAALHIATGIGSTDVVLSRLGTTGTVCLRTSRSANLTADIVGWYPATTSLQTVTPQRLLSTKAPRLGYHGHKPGNGKVVHLKVAGVGHADVPSTASAALLNVTVSGARHPDAVSVYECGAPRPKDAVLRAGKGADAAGLTVSRLSATGKVCLRTSRSADLTADLVGWYPATTPMHAVRPERLLHTSKPQRGYSGHKPAAGSTVRLQVANSGRTAVPSSASAILLTVTVSGVTHSGAVTVYACDTTRPKDASIHVRKGTTTAALTLPQLGAEGQICLHTNRSANLTADILGWYPG
jgi:hypothetical protein